MTVAAGSGALTGKVRRVSLRTVSIACLGFWAAIWIVFFAMRFSSLDIRRMPGIGLVTLLAFGFALLLPFMAAGFSAAAWARQPQDRRNRLAFIWALAALVGQIVLFGLSRWL